MDHKKSFVGVRGGGVLFLALALVGMGLSACGVTFFRDDSRSATRALDKYDKTDKTNEQRPIEMLWIIDNTGSMRDNVDRVQKGLGEFLAELKTKSEVKKVGMISCLESDRPRKGEWHCLPKDFDAGEELIFADQHVGSADALYIALNYLCHQSTPRACGEMVEDIKFVGIKNNTKSNPLYYMIGPWSHDFKRGMCGEYGCRPVDPKDRREMLWHEWWSRDYGTYYHKEKYGSLKNFFTPDSMKAVVVVSDLGTAVMNEDTFLEYWRGIYSETDTLRFYGFIDEASDNYFGGTYQALAQATGGKTYNVAGRESWGSVLSDFVIELEKSGQR